ncbi:PLP-dependent transferase (plasmid) [Pseudoalteromonas espejiana]
MDRHCENAQQLAEYLENHPKVLWVNLRRVKIKTYNTMSQKLIMAKHRYFKLWHCGWSRAGTRFIDALNMILRLLILAMPVASVSSCVNYNRQLNDEELANAGVSRDLIRLSVGIENIADIIADVSQALDDITYKIKSCE